MLTDARTKSLIFRADDPFAIRELIPNSQTISHPDYNIAVHHTREATQLLRNIGFNVPYPEMAAYTWPGKHQPLAHQRAMVDFYLKHKRCFNLSEMGSMKTAPTCWAADILMNEGVIKKAVILSPLSTLERVWQQEIFDVLMHRQCAIVHGGEERRKKALARDVDFYIINHDGIGITEVFEAITKRKDIGLVIIDEGSMFRNASTEKWKLLDRALKRADLRVWWLTGTPCPNGPVDAWAQAKIVSPHRVPPFAGGFKRVTMMQMSTHKWVPKAGSDRIAYEALQPAIRFEKKDCIDLPPVVTVQRQATMTKEQLAAIKTMKNDMQMSDQAGRQITAVNAADKVNKLRQIMLGSIKLADGTYSTIPHAPRFNLLVDTIQEASAKSLVIVPFKGIIKSLERELTKKGFTIGVLNGDVTATQRNKIITDFKTLPDPQVLLCHPEVMAHGLNLTEADMLIFYGPIYSNDEYQQVIERFNRAGQTRKMTIARIGGHPVEWDIYRMVDTRKLTQDNLLRLYNDILQAA